ncbi:hypothetical protein [Chromobacterium violaceum]|uniref:Uncharacterized protein n=1 Tax=Chromobacterium violaceum TaxID=536 RepID=A0AAX2M495_CHRVL|nr:hypothetical protein [Chromobacterium violaceum]OLZ75405.1 hypothetical protein BS642_18350 [Chromobacterium violaceum]STB71788.1 Uncharacterised protein [Chromobacterium violaceum]SUX31227.1 Uncharacterised protein [Chromobacterium violaceum]
MTKFLQAGLCAALFSSVAAATPLSPGQHQLLQGFLMRGCVKRTPASDGVGQPGNEQVQRYCECASEKLASTFTSEEVMGVVTGQIKKDDPRGKQRLKEASAACGQYLEQR